MRTIDGDALIQRLKAIHEAEKQIYGLASWDFTARCIRAVEDAHTIEPEQRWIPCSERLPEDEQPVIFSTKTGRVHQGKYYKDGSVNQWYSALDKMREFNNVVNAWMPLPEPWRGGQNGAV